MIMKWAIMTGWSHYDAFENLLLTVGCKKRR